MRRVLLIVLMAVLASGCATYGGFRGFEAVGGVAGNQAMIASIAGQQDWYGQLYGQFGNVPVCRIQDLAGLPTVSQSVLVRVGKSRGHRMADIIGGAVISGGLVYLVTGDGIAAGVGTAAGAGGGLVVSNHEQELCLYLPVVRP